MSKCTAAEALEAFSYWLDYYEKATREFSETRDKSAFPKNKGSGNYTYAGYYCGINPGAWCAMMVSTAIAEACGGKAGAKEVLYGIWPYAACDQLYDAAPSGKKGKRGYWTPKPGDVVIFGYSTRDHTGMVYAVDDGYIYTYEGNSGNMCRKRAYAKSSSWIWGYVRPDYAPGTTPDIPGEKYGKVCTSDPELHTLSKGCAGPEVASVQALLQRHDYIIDVDGDFGTVTKACVCRFQREHGLSEDGIVGAKTWAALLRDAK